MEFNTVHSGISISHSLPYLHPFSSYFLLFAHLFRPLYVNSPFLLYLLFLLLTSFHSFFLLSPVLLEYILFAFFRTDIQTIHGFAPCTDIYVNKNEYSPCRAGSYLILLSIYNCLLIRAYILYTVGCHLCISISISCLDSMLHSSVDTIRIQAFCRIRMDSSRGIL